MDFDGILPILVVRKQGIEPTAIRFITPFNINTRLRRQNKITDTKPVPPIGFGFILKDYLIFEKFVEMLKNPNLAVEII